MPTATLRIRNADTIGFQIPKTDPGYNPLTNTWTITIGGGFTLPPITRPVILDATTQPGFSGAPLIEISGSGAQTDDGLVLGADPILQTSSSGSTIKGFDIVNFAEAGIKISTNNNIVQNNILGVPVDGSNAPGNNDGVLIAGANNTIGGTAAGTANIIESNTANGVNVSAGNGNAIRQNSIFNNSGLAIKLNAVNPINANHNQGAPSSRVFPPWLARRRSSSSSRTSRLSVSRPVSPTRSSSSHPAHPARRRNSWGNST